MSRLQPVRGTHDLLPDDSRRHRLVIETGRTLAARYGFEEIATPIFEFTEVFTRSIGETTDIVSKEMYTFEDRSGTSLTLRPEGTAGVARAFISGGLSQQVPLKYYYAGPMFRYERPQKGRLRQFHQIGVEHIGIAAPPADVEVIALGAHILDELGVRDQTTLELNTLGDGESRTAYREALVDYFAAHRDHLSEDSRARLERNPLRILDSKSTADKAIVADAPLLSDYLTPGARDIFAAVREDLDALGLAYVINQRLVRGLDYYCHTTFEFTTENLGAQGTVIAGGRYDGLIESMGGPATPGVGWAAGVERLAMALIEPPEPIRPLAVIPIGHSEEAAALKLAQELRHSGFTIELGYGGSLKRWLKRANKLNARCAILIGEDELARGGVTLRDLDSGEQGDVALDELEARLAPYR